MMKRVLLVAAVLAFVVLSGVAWAADGGHVAPVVNSPVTLPAEGLSDPQKKAVVEALHSSVTVISDVNLGGAPGQEYLNAIVNYFKDVAFSGSGTVSSVALWSVSTLFSWQGPALVLLPAANKTQLLNGLRLATGASLANQRLALYLQKKGGGFAEFNYAPLASFGPGRFTFVTAGGQPATVSSLSEIAAASEEDLVPVVYVNPSDLGYVAGEMVTLSSTIATQQETPPPPGGSGSGGSSGGCDAGFSGAALLLLAGAWILSKKRRA